MTPKFVPSGLEIHKSNWIHDTPPECLINILYSACSYIETEVLIYPHPPKLKNPI